MALSDKNIVITPNIGATDDPKIVFSGADASTAAQDITLYTYPTSNGTVSFEGSAGQLFSITNDLTGTIFSVNDVSGIPSIEVDADGTIKLAEFGGNVLIGTATDNGTDLLQVDGSVLATTFSGDLSGNATTSSSTTGNAATATILQTARTINGVSFNGSANITVADDTKLPLTGGTLSGGLDITGDLNAVDNIYLAGSLYHEGDTNTRLLFGTDTVTLQTAGSSEITVNATGVRLGDTGNGYFQPVTGNYGSVQIDGGAHTGYEGYSIGGRVVFMHNNSSTMGLYDDVNNEWAFRYTFNGAAELYHNATARVTTTSAGADINGTLQADALANGSGVGKINYDSSSFFSGAFSDEVNALGNTGTAQTINCSTGTVVTATLTGNCTFTLSTPNSTASRATSFTLILTNDATAGRTVAFSGGTFKYPGGSVSRTTDANATDIWFFFSPDNGTTWYVTLPAKNLT